MLDAEGDGNRTAPVRKFADADHAAGLLGLHGLGSLAIGERDHHVHAAVVRGILAREQDADARYVHRGGGIVQVMVRDVGAANAHGRGDQSATLGSALGSRGRSFLRFRLNTMGRGNGRVFRLHLRLGVFRREIRFELFQAQIIETESFRSGIKRRGARRCMVARLARCACLLGRK